MIIIMFNSDKKIVASIDEQEWNEKNAKSITLEGHVEMIRTEEGSKPGITLYVLEIDGGVFMSTTKHPVRLALGETVTYVFDA